MKRIGLVLIAAGLAGEACAVARTTAAAAWLGPVEAISSPAAALGSAQPQLNAVGDRLLLSWIEIINADAALKFAERTSTGWSDARTVAAGRDWFVNWADVPSVVRLADGSLAAHWLQENKAGGEAYDVRLAFSSDDGRTWSAPTSPHHDGTATEHGFASLFPGSGGGLGLVWLDGRAMKPMKPGDDEMTGNMGLRAATFDRKGSQLSETQIDDRVCECCPTAAAVTADGPIVAFRDRSQNEVRDIYVSRLVDGRWTPAAPVHRDNWRINACPVNGPALSASGRDVVIAWFTAAGDKGHVFAAFSSDAGQTFGTPIRVDDVGALGRVDVEILPDRSAVVSWIEFAGQRSQFRVRRVERSGARSESASVTGISSSRASGYPRMARRGDEVVFAWTDTDGGSRVRTAAARVSGSSTR